MDSIETVVIQGSGPIGILAVAAAQEMGAGQSAADAMSAGIITFEPTASGLSIKSEVNCRPHSTTTAPISCVNANGHGSGVEPPEQSVFRVDPRRLAEIDSGGATQFLRGLARIPDKPWVGFGALRIEPCRGTAIFKSR